jgi:hypothetical protein
MERVTGKVAFDTKAEIVHLTICLTPLELPFPYETVLFQLPEKSAIPSKMQNGEHH